MHIPEKIKNYIIGAWIAFIIIGCIVAIIYWSLAEPTDTYDPSTYYNDLY